MTGITLQDGQADAPSERSTRSYWHREPSNVLLGHRTTTSLPPTADVVVVGSGITGAFAARFLKESDGGDGTEVLMLEAREACWGATGRNGGHCQPNLYVPAPAIAHFEAQTYTFLRDFVVSHDIPCDWTSLQGVHAFYTPDLLARAALRIADLARSHPQLAAGARVVRSADKLADLHIPGAVGAVVQTAAASCWPYKLVSWVLEDLLRRFGAQEQKRKADGVDGTNGRGWFNLQTNTPVDHLQRLGGTDDGYRWMVHTSRGQVAARHVLLACNGYTSRLVSELSDLIVPVRGQVAALLPRAGQDALTHSYVFMGEPPDGPVQDDYLIQRPCGKKEMILGGGRGWGEGKGVGVSADDWIDPVVARYLRRALASSMRLGGGRKKTDGDEDDKEEEMEADYEWTGIMGFSRDGCPWVGEVPAWLGGGDGLWMAAGYTGHGMPQAALCAKAVVDMMTGQGGDGKGDGVGLPDEFRVTKSRVEMARSMDTVREADAKNMFL
ncbi:hypothetical protein ACRALDRAFT_1061818 [Sodiomyces alcalophilus JCM 7366]|uniref:uncharacterized protein n=1 Tax=Sodiomyces alcalophilus JCM 7366 TaxID=591952 RepID=UPI0039B582EC